MKNTAAGPWRLGTVDERHNTIHVWTDREYPKGQCIAEVHEIQFGDLMPTAHLIAASPDLLKACRSALAGMQARADTRRKWTMTDQRDYETLEAAVAKAEGR